VDSEWVEVLETALGAEPRDTPERARLLATLALEYGYEPDYTRRLALVDESVAVARRIGDPAVILEALARPAQIGLVPELADDFRQRIAEAVGLAEHGGDPVMRFSAHRARTSLLVEHGHIDGVDDSQHIMADIAHTLNHPVMKWIHLVSRSWRIFLAGDINHAEQLADQALKVGLASGQAEAPLAYAVNIFTIRQHQGRAGELLQMMDQAAGQFPDVQGIRSGLATAAVQAEQPSRARDLLHAAWQSGFALPKDVTWLTTATTWAEVAADLQENGPAQILYRLLSPWHDRVPIGGAAVSHCVAHTLGRLAQLLGQHDNATRHFSQALTIHQRLGAPHFAARTKLALDGIEALR
jgi:hypothetical protein